MLGAEELLTTMGELDAGMLLCVVWLLDDGVTSFELDDPGSTVPVHADIIADASAKGTILRISPSS